MKNNKAEGPDNIPVEMLKCLDGKATPVYAKPCTQQGSAARKNLENCNFKVGLHAYFHKLC